LRAYSSNLNKSKNEKKERKNLVILGWLLTLNRITWV